MGGVPERIAWTVERLALHPTDHVLEIGCGRGVAAALVCPVLTAGRMTGVDRSATALDAARAANAPWVDNGRLELLQADFTQADLGRRFGRVFAINVNAFWTAPAEAAAGARRLATPGARARHLAEDLPASLRAAGFGVELVERPDGERPLVGVTARAPW
jgi:SAM-dependent methyltransferase